MSTEWESTIVQQDVSGVVSRGPVFLRSCSISSSSNGGSILIYDGLNTSGKLKLRLYIDAAGSFERTFRKQIRFDTGIWAEIDDATTYGNFEIWPAHKGPIAL